jgi:two-component system OmpR family response regulator
MRVLLVEDAPGLGDAVREQIADDGHAVDWVQRLEHARNSVRTTPYDLILLDLMLPDGRGLDFCASSARPGM